jgi:glc operon protein GlcG
MMNLEMAKKLLQTGMKKADEKGMLCSIAIVDENGWLVALYRMDGTPMPSVEIARDKAWTAATFRMPSSEVSQLGDPRVPGYGFNVQNWNERLTTIPGGLPIWHNRHLAGAIGVCSQTPKEDVSLCKNILKDVFGEKRDLRSERRKPRKKYGRK